MGLMHGLLWICWCQCNFDSLPLADLQARRKLYDSAEDFSKSNVSAISFLLGCALLDDGPILHAYKIPEFINSRARRSVSSSRLSDCSSCSSLSRSEGATHSSSSLASLDLSNTPINTMPDSFLTLERKESTTNQTKDPALSTDSAFLLLD